MGVIILMACGPVRPGTTSPSSAGPGLTVFAAESDAFPSAAKAATEALDQAQVAGFDAPQRSKVSMEVVQLSIECVDPSPTCYAAVGRELKVSQLLFAQIEKGPKPKAVRVTVTLFDVGAGAAKHSAVKVFASEQEATLGVRDVVEEATRP